MARYYRSNGLLLEKRDAENLQDFAKTAIDLQFFLDDGHKHINADGDPDLGLHGIVGSSVESFDSQVLFDPLEKEFDVPAAFVEVWNRQRWKIEVVGEKDEVLVCFEVDVADASKGVGIIFRRLISVENDRLVAAQSRCLVDVTIRSPSEVEVVFGADDEERHLLGEAMKSLEIDVGSIEDIKSSGFQGEIVEEIDVVHIPLGKSHKTRDSAAKIQERMQLHCRFVLAKACPGKERQAEVDRRRIEGIRCMVQVDTKTIVGIQLSRFPDEDVRHVGMNTPVAFLVGIGQRAARNRPPNPGVIQFGTHRS